ncbi:uncharacterized protein VP01_7g11 [Puccinia sorghi]|uniref:Uncharacterized protein n=1 Tax=Puccinia sorghi TaxID=27349 RepID=A0A0L6UAM9_9BASI|nr:uncharacterized protein VP01_7g11 [Puccinia sorghi]
MACRLGNRNRGVLVGRRSEPESNTNGKGVPKLNFPSTKKKKKSVAKSTCGAEFIALSSTVDLTIFLLLILWKTFPYFKCRVLCNNQVAVLVASDNGSRSNLRSILERKPDSIGEYPSLTPIKKHSLVTTLCTLQLEKRL